MKKAATVNFVKHPTTVVKCSGAFIRCFFLVKP